MFSPIHVVPPMWVLPDFYTTLLWKYELLTQNIDVWRENIKLYIPLLDKQSKILIIFPVKL